MIESWLPVVGYEGLYEVSDHGRVRSLDRVVLGRNRTGRVLAICYAGRRRVPQVSIGRDGVIRHRKIHQLVLEAFVGPCPPGMEGCHNDDDTQNNHLSNLRWDTRSANEIDAFRNGKKAWNGKSPFIKTGGT